VRVRLLRRIKELEQMVEVKNREIARLHHRLTAPKATEEDQEEEEEADPTIWTQMSTIAKKIGPKGGNDEP